MGQALQILIGWPVFLSAALVASISAVYVTFGGQTSVIMTDLFQGFMPFYQLLLLLFVNIWRPHRVQSSPLSPLAFPDFNSSSSIQLGCPAADATNWQCSLPQSEMVTPDAVARR